MFFSERIPKSKTDPIRPLRVAEKRKQTLFERQVELIRELVKLTLHFGEKKLLEYEEIFPAARIKKKLYEVKSSSIITVHPTN